MPKAHLPVAILGGYLGAGKTTLVNHLLRHAEGMRLAVVVNDFGELPIDEDLIEARDEEIISIAGGCVCCSYGNDLAGALMELSRMEPRPDHILLETSGVAMPGAIGASVDLLPDFTTDGVVVLTDAETVQRLAKDRYIGDTILRQIEQADLVILNKTDLVPDTTLHGTLDWFAHIQPGLPVLPATHGSVPPEAVLSSNLERVRKPGTKHIDNPVVSQVLQPAGPVDAAFLARDLAAPERGLLRAKGFVHGADGVTYLIQVVGRRWSVSKAAHEREDGIVCLGIEGQMDLSESKSMMRA